MTKDSDFSERLARIEAIQGKRPPLTDRSFEAPPSYSVAPRRSGNIGMISATAGLALIAGVIGWNWDRFAPLLPGERAGTQMTFLEKTAYDSMSEDEINRMNSNPDFDGKSTIHKILLSN